jgi:hypothetical protein
MTDRYTDEKSIPLAKGIAKLAQALPSSIASPNFGFSCPNKGKPVPDQVIDGANENGGNVLERSALSFAVQYSEAEKVGARGGTRTPMQLSTGF